MGQAWQAESEGRAMMLPNDTKIQFCNAFQAMQNHLGNCDACCLYLYHGDGDLCEKGKEIIAREVAYSDTNLERMAL